MTRVQGPPGVPVLVGQAPGPSSSAAAPLVGDSGRRLAALAGLDYPAGYLEAFARVNLLDSFPGSVANGGDRFPGGPARGSAAELLPELVGRRAILLGAGVARAFLWRGTPLTWGEVRVCVGDRLEVVRLAHLPHPSGRSRWWNAPGNVWRARRFLLETLASPG